MHHLTTLNLPAVESREAERQALAALTSDYIAGGGTVQRLEITARTPEPKGSLRDRPRTTSRISGCSRRELKKRDDELAKRAQALANARMPGDRIRKKLGLGPVTFEQLIARHGIRLPTRRSAP